LYVRRWPNRRGRAARDDGEYGIAALARPG